MKKLSAALSLAAVFAAACSDGGNTPTQPGAVASSAATAASSVASGAHVLPTRGSASLAGVRSQAGIPITYHGGPILPATKVVVIYWATNTVYAGGPAPGTTGTGTQDGSLVGHFLRNLGGSPYFNINTTYTDAVGGGHTVGNSVTYTGFWADNTGVPPANGSNVTDATMQAEINKGFTSGKIVYDPQTIYAILTFGNTNLGGGFGSQYCAYHFNYTFNNQLVIYAAMPYVGQFLNGCSNLTASPNNDAPADALVNVFGHEIEESTTDYALNAWFDAQGQENADKCAWTFGTTYNNGTGIANMNLGGKDFLIQQNWVASNVQACALSFGGTTNQPPVASFSYSCNNLVCNFDGTGSTDDVGIVSYLWTGPGGSTVGTTATFSHTFTAATTLNLTLKVTDGGGLSNSITKQVVVTGGGTNQPPVASWTYSCTTAHVCTFDGTSSHDPDGTIVSYSWKGPNNAVLATTATFTRTFPGATTGNVTLTVTDNGGATNSKTQTVVVP